MAQRERKNRKRERVRLRHREWSLSEDEQTIFTLISIPLLPRNTNNVPPNEPEANRDKAASLLTLGLYSSVLNQWQAAHTSRKLSCGIKSKSQERKQERGWRKRRDGRRGREARDRRGGRGKKTEQMRGREHKGGREDGGRRGWRRDSKREEGRNREQKGAIESWRWKRKEKEVIKKWEKVNKEEEVEKQDFGFKFWHANIQIMTLMYEHHDWVRKGSEVHNT